MCSTHTGSVFYKKYGKDINLFEETVNLEYYIKTTFSKSIALEKGINSASDLPLVIKKYWWKYPCSIDKTIIKFLTRSGWMSSKDDYARNCQLCNELGIGREHYINECIKLIGVREFIKRELKIASCKNNELTNIVDDLFFKQSIDIGPKEIRKRIKIIKTIFEMIRNQIKEKKDEDK